MSVDPLYYTSWYQPVEDGYGKSVEQQTDDNVAYDGLRLINLRLTVTVRYCTKNCSVGEISGGVHTNEYRKYANGHFDQIT